MLRAAGVAFAPLFNEKMQQNYDISVLLKQAAKVSAALAVPANAKRQQQKQQEQQGAEATAENKHHITCNYFP